MKCLSKSPADRYASATALAEALQRIVHAGDWSKDQARAWWRTYAAKAAAPPSSDAPTQTMQIDLDKRA